MKNLSKLQEMESVRNEVEKCIGCGCCLFYCPVYSETADEDYVARGRNRLVKGLLEDCQDLVSGAKDRFDKCLLCGRCTMACPQGVRNDLVTLAARGELVKHNGLPLPKSLAFRKLMKNRENMRKAIRAAGKFQWMLPVSRRKEEGARALLEGWKTRHVLKNLPGSNGGRHVPSIAGSFLSDLVPEINPPDARAENRGIRVAFFSGCATEFVLPQVGKAVIGLLNRSGVEVLFPKSQGCCGIAVHAGGDIDTAREMALHNLAVLSELNPDFIVTGCATCGSALKEGWISLMNDDAGKTAFVELADKVRDVSEFILQLADLKPLRYRSLLPDNIRVTYHDPCHLARHQGITEEPRKILRQVFGNRFVEMDNNGCCGFGGSFNLNNYTLSRKIGQDKIQSIKRTGADVVITACPGCMIQLTDGIERDSMPHRVIHLVNAVEPLEIS